MKTLSKKEINLLIENKIKSTTKSNLILENYTKSYSNWMDSVSSKDEKFMVMDRILKTKNKLIVEGHDPILVEGWMGDLFKSFFGGNISTIKEWIVRKILNAVGVKGELAEALTVGFSNLNWRRDWTKFLSPLQNCEYISDILVHSIIEYYVKRKVEETFGTGGFLANSLRNSIIDTLDSEEHIQKLQDMIYQPVCAALRNGFSGPCHLCHIGVCGY